MMVGLSPDENEVMGWAGSFADALTDCADRVGEDEGGQMLYSFYFKTAHDSILQSFFDLFDFDDDLN